MVEEQRFGIDLGTTCSAIATLDEHQQPVIVPNQEGRSTTPSIVYVRSGGTTLVGEPARQEMALDSEGAARFFKRDMGTATSYTYQGVAWSPVGLSAEVLRKLKDDAALHLHTEVRQCVITVPAYFQDGARVATREAGAMAGLEVLQVLNEPTAAAIAYGTKGKSGTVLVYDLGGGTFDISLVRICPDGIEVVGTDGNHTLGGKDWDDRIAQYVCDIFRQRHRIDPLDDAAVFQDILTRSEEAKKTLSSALRAVVPVNCGGKMDRVEVTRELFESLTRDLLSQTETLVEKVLEETSHERRDVSSVLLAGGSTLMPACRDLAQRLTGDPPNTSVNPHECVALGAAIHAAGFDRASTGIARRIRVSDVMSHSLGMIAVNPAGDRYINSILIARNRPIPGRETRPYVTHGAAAGDNSLSIYVTQGETEDPLECSFVAKFVAPLASAGPASTQVLDIGYEYDVSGVVNVSATVRATGAKLAVRKEGDLGDLSWVFLPPQQKKVAVHKTIYAAIDLSGSMAGAPLENAKKALCGFVWNLDLAHSSAGLISFADRVEVDCEACRNAPLLEKRIKAWRAGSVGGGNSTDPFEKSLSLLQDLEGDKFIVVLTDGMWVAPEEAQQRARKCRDAGIDIIAIGFGSADHEFLRSLATTDESALFVASGDLTATFGDIAQVLLEDGFAGVHRLRRRAAE